MNTCLSSAELKSRSRGQLLGKYGTVIFTEFTIHAIMSASLMLCFVLADTSTIAGHIISLLIWFILSIIQGIFTAGLTRFYFNLVCDRPYRVSDVFYCFRTHADKALAIRFFLLAAWLLCMVPYFVCSYFYRRELSAAFFLAACIAAVIGGAACLYIFLLYSQVYYILLDFPGYSVRQIMSTSRRIMKGNKGRLFYIGVTLLPYYLLAFLSCGIASIWVTPYWNTIATNFYLDIIQREYTA